MAAEAEPMQENGQVGQGTSVQGNDRVFEEWASILFAREYELQNKAKPQTQSRVAIYKTAAATNQERHPDTMIPLGLIDATLLLPGEGRFLKKLDVAIGFLHITQRSPKDWRAVSESLVPDPQAIAKVYEIDEHRSFCDAEIQCILTVDAIFLACFLLFRLNRSGSELGQIVDIFNEHSRQFVEELSLQILRPDKQIPLKLVRDVYVLLIEQKCLTADCKSDDLTECGNIILGNTCAAFVGSNAFPRMITPSFRGLEIRRRLDVETSWEIISVNDNSPCEHLLHCQAEAVWASANPVKYVHQPMMSTSLAGMILNLLYKSLIDRNFHRSLKDCDEQLKTDLKAIYQEPEAENEPQGDQSSESKVAQQGDRGGEPNEERQENSTPRDQGSELESKEEHGRERDSSQKVQESEQRLSEAGCCYCFLLASKWLFLEIIFVFMIIVIFFMFILPESLRKLWERLVLSVKHSAIRFTCWIQRRVCCREKGVTADSEESPPEVHPFMIKLHVASALPTAKELHKYGVSIKGHHAIFPRFERHKFQPWKATLYLPEIHALGKDTTRLWGFLLAFEERWTRDTGIYDTTNENCRETVELTYKILHQPNAMQSSNLSIVRRVDLREITRNPPHPTARLAQSPRRKPFLSFLQLMDDLIDTEDDVEVLTAGSRPVILTHSLGHRGSVANFFNSITQGYSSGRRRDGPEWVQLIDEVSKFHTSRRRRLILEFVTSKCKPWVLVSIFVASLVLSATALQTVYTVQGYYHPR